MDFLQDDDGAKVRNPPLNLALKLPWSTNANVHDLSSEGGYNHPRSLMFAALLS